MARALSRISRKRGLTSAAAPPQRGHCFHAPVVLHPSSRNPAEDEANRGEAAVINAAAINAAGGEASKTQIDGETNRQT